MQNNEMTPLVAQSLLNVPDMPTYRAGNHFQEE